MDHLLSIVTFLPLLGALACFLTPGEVANW